MQVSARLATLTACMLVSGSVNTIATKYQDITVIGHTADGKDLTFKHPAVQSAFMFLGETLCLIPYFFLRWRKRRRKIAEFGAPVVSSSSRSNKRTRRLRITAAFALPAFCDAGATTLLNIGLYYTYASTFQMLRGTLVLWAGLLTIVLLHRRLHIHHWFGMVLIVAGAAIVGASSIIYDKKIVPPHPSDFDQTLFQALTKSHKHPAVQEAKDPVLGDILVVIAQVAAALQFIIEEKYLAKYRVPALLGVGLEGMWGLILSAIALPILSIVKGPGGTPLDSLVTAAHEIRGSWQVQVSTVGSIVSIAFFNFFGLSVTKSLSGGARAAIDACRTLLIWLFSIQIGWERFHGLQVLGFCVLVFGTSMYNELLRGCLPGVPSRAVSEEADSDLQEPLLNSEAGQPPPSAPVRAHPPRPTGPPSRRPSALPQSISSMPFVPRSVRLFPHMFSPHSLASPQASTVWADSPGSEAFGPTARKSNIWPGTTPSSHHHSMLDASLHGQLPPAPPQGQAVQQRGDTEHDKDEQNSSP